MNYQTVVEWCSIVGASYSETVKHCRTGRIPGAIRQPVPGSNLTQWLIPEGTKRPTKLTVGAKPKKPRPL